VTIYPLTNGIPAASPDRTITTLRNPIAVAVGPRGFIYVWGKSQTGGGRVRLDVFFPKASGNAAPLRVLLPPPGSITVGVTVGPGGFEFLTGYYPTVPDALVYSPQAKGQNPALQTIALTGFRPVDDGLDSSGTLYVLTQGTLFTFATPITNPTPGRQFCMSQLTGGLAVGPDGTTYVTLGKLLKRLPARVNVYAPSVNGGCPSPARSIRTIESTTTPIGTPTGAALNGTLLYVLDANNPTLGGPAIFVFNALQGSQAPLAIISGSSSQLASPARIAVGL
jgi:hypothetical protein